MEGNGRRYGRCGVDAGCCWLERRYLDLGWDLAFGARSGISTTISTSSHESSGSAGSRHGSTRRCLHGLVVGVICSIVSPFCGALEARVCYSGSRTLGYGRACEGVSSET